MRPLCAWQAPHLLPAREHPTASNFPCAAAELGAGVCLRSMGGQGEGRGDGVGELGKEGQRLAGHFVDACSPERSPQAPGMAPRASPFPPAVSPADVGDRLDEKMLFPGCPASLRGEHVPVVCTCVRCVVQVCLHAHPPPPNQTRSHWKHICPLLRQGRAGPRPSGGAGPEPVLIWEEK